MERHIRRMMEDIKRRRTYDELKQLKQRRKEKRAARHMTPPTGDDEHWDDHQWDAEDQKARAQGKRGPKKRKKSPTKSPKESEPAVRRIRGVVFTMRKRRVRASIEGRLVTCWLTAEMAADQKSAVAVGDEILIEERGNDYLVTEVLPRRTTLSRPDPFDLTTERVVAANVDVVIQVSAIKNPPLKAGLIDRYLIAIELGGAKPVVCFNKIDLVDDENRTLLDDLTAEYRSIGVPVVGVSTKSGEGIPELRELVAGQFAVLVGHSGVGKSSILNKLDESLSLATAELHKEGNVGRHTTTSSTLYEFPDGTRLIDTPGIREFGLWDTSASELRLYFPEFVEPSQGCRYRNCTHLHEPECAVKASAERGELPRYDRYRRMVEEP